jgi:hypothetical protein
MKLQSMPLNPGANPKTLSCNASVVKIYSAANSMVRFRTFFADVKTL